MEEAIKRETVGSLASDLLLKEPETRDPIELQRAIHEKEYEKNLFEAVERGKTLYKSPFYIVVVTKKERLMQNVLRNYFFPCQACPTPTWDQVVYRYTANDEKLEYLWNVPDKQTCELLKSNALQVVKEEQWLLKMVLDFADGTLDKKARIYNGELVA
jgi:hypothetical protein